ncbi:cytochrome c3 family protein [Sulfurimonas sp.]|uniref:cytochrome c3 family protein n=1 Tax=Sulfurimonas sp. TaxID=2022749 RepID=UPI00261044CD|nr:cytochrome c3 family protein [Sulfurimonas sp.]MCW8895586.1 cytochrome c3 family protein [Sulfurimonas sp.]
MKSLILTLSVFLFFSTIELTASIVNTKHNLSVTSTAGTIKATSETEVCVFCHIPHFSQSVGKPLWNRSMPTTEYVMYDSDYLRRMGYPAIASDLGSANDTPGALSRQCLSCHDGTIAVGAVSKLRRDYDGSSTIDMSGDAPDGTIPDTATGFIGADLSNHHPVGIIYDPTVSKTFGNGGIRGMELKAVPDSSVKLYEYAGYSGKYVECSSCHDPHKDNSKFLHVDSGANHAQNFVNTCTACHEKTNWVGSVHQSPPGSPTYTDADLIAKYGTGAVGELGCVNCHVPHNGEGVGYLNRQVNEQTCFQGAASTEGGAACHGVGGAKDIKTILSRTYTHPVLAEDNLPGTQHTNLDTLYGTGVVGDPAGINKGMSWTDNKHAVCMDCHNPHQAQAGTHIVDGSWYGQPGGSTNLVSNVLKGVSGVEPTWPAEWTQPDTFTTMESSEKEYQICFKCHSYWGMGLVADKYAPSTYTSAGGTLLTDVAWEMNINNKSGHPVVINQTARSGSYAPKELHSSQLLTPWTENPGLNSMYCSDCHGADNELGGDPKGPHGSNLKYILKGVNHQWPHKSDNVTLYTMDDIGTAGDSDLFCKNCHDVAHPHDKWRNQMANKGYACVECHVVVPHGSPVSRLMGYYTFPEPYNYNGNMLKMTGWKKKAYDPNDVGTRTNAYSPGCGGGGMCHNSNAGGYDLNVMP